MKRVPMLIPFLVLVFVTFVGILIYVWAESKKANPKMLDEQGRVKDTAGLIHRRGAETPSLKAVFGHDA